MADREPIAWGVMQTKDGEHYKLVKSYTRSGPARSLVTRWTKQEAGSPHSRTGIGWEAVPLYL